MRVFTKGYFIAVFCMSLLITLVTFGALIALIIFSLLGDIRPFNLISIIIALCAGVSLIIFFIKSSILFIKATSMQDEDLIKNRKRFLGCGIFIAVFYSTTIIFFIPLCVCMILTNNFIKKLENAEYEEKSLDFKIKKTSKTTVEGAKDVFGIKSKSEKLRESIEELKALKDEGIITEEEYNAKRSELVSKL